MDKPEHNFQFSASIYHQTDVPCPPPPPMSDLLMSSRYEFMTRNNFAYRGLISSPAPISRQRHHHHYQQQPQQQSLITPISCLSLNRSDYQRGSLQSIRSDFSSQNTLSRFSNFSLTSTPIATRSRKTVKRPVIKLAIKRFVNFHVESKSPLNFTKSITNFIPAVFDF